MGTVAQMPANGLAKTINILVGTMTGTAEMVAQEVQIAVEDAGYQASIIMMESFEAEALKAGEIYLICSSTYGNGDVPDNAQKLVEQLQVERPNLTNVTYGVIALGDMTYKATFCQGGLRFDSLFTELGATRAGAPLLHDANSGTLPEDVACEWAKTWISRDLATMMEAA
jgi:MioC protein